MPRNDFVLSTGAGAAFLIPPPPQEVRVPLRGRRPLVGPGDAVAEGSPVGEPADPLRPWAHSPLAGEVRDVVDDQVIVRSGPSAVPAPKPVDLDVPGRDALAETLARCGVDVTSLAPARQLIVNACPPEPGVTLTGRLLRDYRDTLSRGLQLARALVSPTKVSVAGPDVDASAFGNCEVVRIKPRYPLNLAPLVCKAVTGRERAGDVTVVDLFQLVALGRVRETGRPVTDVLVSVQGRNVLARVGTPLAELLAAAELRPEDGDRVAIGGVLRGEAAHRLDQPLTRDIHLLSLIPAGSHPPVRDAACLNCGLCARHCPARIFPGELSMCAEAGLFERARQGHVEACFECGICGYVCPARRPLLQYLQLAKSELRLLDAAREAESSEASEGAL